MTSFAPAMLAAPASVAEIELSEPVAVRYHSVAEDAGSAAGARHALVLVRLNRAPRGVIVVDAPHGRVDAASCASAAWAAIDSGMRPCDGCDPPSMRGGSIYPPAAEGSGSRRAAADDPDVTVVIATRERPARLAACLDSLERLDYPRFEVVVVDNDPVTDETAEMVRRRSTPHLRYVRESRRGLAAAHNRGLRLAEGRIVAFTDDDVTVDRHWLSEIARGFSAHPDVACVTGLIFPAELLTPAQVLLETQGNFSKGFEQRVFDMTGNRPVDPLFPFTTGRLGSGANMSFDRDVLRRLGGFDPAIGAGTPARGGDDLAAFFSVLVAGHRLVYQPGALVWHHHHRDPAALARQAYNYGVGLGAYAASALAHHPGMAFRALRHAPAALAYAWRPGSTRTAHRQASWPRELTRAERRGMAFGPVAYGIGRWRARRAPRPFPGPEA